MPVTKPDIEIKPLPWFPFNIKAYMTDTMRLSTEAHGAYLLLMLDYYSMAEPPPDDDDVLAAITKLPASDWIKYRKVLAPLFQIRDGHWFHDRIEAEMLEACSKHAASKAKAEAASAARWSKTGKNKPQEKPAAMPQASLEDAAGRKRPSRIATGTPQAAAEQSLGDAHKQEHLSDNREGVARSPAKVLGDVGGEQEPTAPVTITDTMIAPDFRPPQKLIDAAMSDCGDLAVVEHELRMFVAHMQEKAAFSANWDASWVKWWGRWKANEAQRIAQANGAKPKAAPRVQVNKQPEPADYEAALMRWMANESMWSFKHYGPEPGAAGCRVPPEIFARHGLDPRTGRKLQPAG